MNEAITGNADAAPTDQQRSHPLLTAVDLAAMLSAVHGAPINLDDDVFLAGLNSLDIVRVIGAVENQTEVRLMAGDILDNPTARMLSDLIARRTVTRSSAPAGAQDTGSGSEQDDLRP